MPFKSTLIIVLNIASVPAANHREHNYAGVLRPSQLHPEHFIGLVLYKCITNTPAVACTHACTRYCSTLCPNVSADRMPGTFDVRSLVAAVNMR